MNFLVRAAIGDLVDESYGTSALSGVTLSTSISDAGYSPENGSLRIDGTGTDSFTGSGLIDNSLGLEFDNVSSSKNLLDDTEIEDVLFDNYEVAENVSDHSVIDELEESEILIYLDTI